MTDYAPGTPCWIELALADDASLQFYADLFGWSATDAAADFGGYRSLLDDGKSVAGASPMGEAHVWTTYVAVTDATATAAKVTDAGGQILLEPMAVGALGHMAICADPEGAVFGLWQPGEHKGAEKVNEPVSLCWNELSTRDLATAKDFYAAVFGWSPQDMPMPDGTYTVMNLGDRPVAGAMTMPAQVPETVPPNWGVYFAVADTDAMVEAARGLGAQVLFGPADIPGVGRFAALADPQGAPFSVLQAQSPDE